MPGRKIPLVTGEMYHIVNRGVAGQPVFSNKWDYRRFLNIFAYYQYKEVPIRYSKFMELSADTRNQIIEGLAKQQRVYVEIVSFCLMPNHVHLLVTQKEDGGISKYMSNITNSYTRYFNTKYSRQGHLFQGKFKAVRIETEDQLLHVVRYIHLNPYSSYVVNSLDELASYPYSSFLLYLGTAGLPWLKKSLVLDHFGSIKVFKRFIFDQADYQRALQDIKHLLLEE